VIFTYGFSAVGSSHLKNGTVCQDANKVLTLDNGVFVAAIADGVGSCQFSDIASSIAVDVSLRVCAEQIEADSNCNLLAVIEKAFERAEREIDEYSLSKNHLITDYDTTLSLAIYDGKNLAYGHCGDGGIIGLTNDGDYIKITSPQKTDGMFVVPLRAGKDSWVIESSQHKFASLLLATDGIYDIFFPYLLKGQPVEVYVPLIRYFMDNNVLKVSDETIDDIGKEREEYLKGDACASVTDDKTILVLINAEAPLTTKENSYYTEPDWDALQLEWNKKAYPHLYKDAEDSSTENKASSKSKESKK